jgi:hypothetical protein
VAGSNALASQLFKSVNHNNSSSRSSNGDNEDFCSDASLEDDVVDLGHKVIFLFGRYPFSVDFHPALEAVAAERNVRRVGCGRRAVTLAALYRSSSSLRSHVDFIDRRRL